MKPIKFPQVNAIIAEDQPEYIPLPVCFLDNKESTVVSCWRVPFWQRVKLLFSGKIWIGAMTFGAPPSPILPSINKAFVMPQGAPRLDLPALKSDKK